MEYIGISDDSEFEKELPTAADISKDNQIQWNSNTITTSGPTEKNNIMKLVSGITKYAVTRISDEMTTFQLFITTYQKNLLAE